MLRCLLLVASYLQLQALPAGHGAAATLPQPAVLLQRAAHAPVQGCKKVVVSAPVKDPQPVLNVVYGVNHVRRAHCCSHAVET